MKLNQSSQSGQAMLEFAILMPLYGLLFAAIVAFGEWVAVRQQMISLVREAAWLYSSGRVDPEEVKRLIITSARQGHPMLSLSGGDIFLGRSEDSEAANFELDEIRIVYLPTILMKRFSFQTIQEKCVIKHAPPYRLAAFPLLNSGPPVSW